MRIILLFLLAAVASSAQAATLADKLRPYIGQPAKLAPGEGTIDAKLLSVDADHFCVEARPPGFTHERCYAITAISFITKPIEERPLWIAVIEPQR